jgi:hypothetical protein
MDSRSSYLKALSTAGVRDTSQHGGVVTAWTAPDPASGLLPLAGRVSLDARLSF